MFFTYTYTRLLLYSSSLIHFLTCLLSLIPLCSSFPGLNFLFQVSFSCGCVETERLIESPPPLPPPPLLLSSFLWPPSASKAKLLPNPSHSLSCSVAPHQPWWFCGCKFYWLQQRHRGSIMWWQHKELSITLFCPVPRTEKKRHSARLEPKVWMLKYLFRWW